MKNYIYNRHKHTYKRRRKQNNEPKKECEVLHKAKNKTS